jgi:hypothetical protein
MVLQGTGEYLKLPFLVMILAALNPDLPAQIPFALQEC